MKKKKEYKGAVMALDVASYSTGYAIYKNGLIENHGTWKFKKETRYINIINKIRDAVKKYGITQIVAEDIYKDKDAKKTSAYNVLNGCRVLVEAVVQEYKLEFAVIQPITVKQKIWGMRYQQNLTRDEQKARMINAIQRFGYELEKADADDEADAIGVLIVWLNDWNYMLQHPK